MVTVAHTCVKDLEFKKNYIWRPLVFLEFYSISHKVEDIKNTYTKYQYNIKPAFHSKKETNETTQATNRSLIL